VENNEQSWPWGLREASSVGQPATAPPGLRLASVRFLVTWSTAVIAAIGTATAAFVSTAATDLGQQTVTSVTGQSAPGSTQVHG
jgi:hypothetical protein